MISCRFAQLVFIFTALPGLSTAQAPPGGGGKSATGISSAKCRLGCKANLFGNLGDAELGLPPSHK